VVMLKLMIVIARACFYCSSENASATSCFHIQHVGSFSAWRNKHVLPSGGLLPPACDGTTWAALLVRVCPGNERAYCDANCTTPRWSLFPKHSIAVACKICATMCTYWNAECEYHYHGSCIVQASVEHDFVRATMQMYSTKTDVWSMGVILVELCNRNLPYSNLYLTPLQVAMGVADRKLSPALESDGYPGLLVALIDSCLQQEPAARPHFIQIVEQLKSVIVLVKKLEAEQEQARQGSLFGRVSGMIQGVTAQAAAGLQRESSRPWARDLSGHHSHSTAPPRPPVARETSAQRSAPRHHQAPHQRMPQAPPVPQMRSSATSMLKGWMGRTGRWPADG
jgi:hypothetical protein